MSELEFSRPFPVDRVPELGAFEKLEAEAAERAALAERFGLVSIGQFAGKLHLKPWRKGGLVVAGELSATVTQTCVVSLEPFEQELTVPVERYFLGQTNAGATQISHLEDLEDDELDVISGSSVDLGELAAESLGLALDPYPRKPGAVFIAADGENAPEAPRNPFASLAKLREKGD